jgi:hypothetical protein
MMKTVTVDTFVRSKLENLDSPLELRDEAGTTLGYFVPVAERQRMMVRMGPDGLRG